MPYGAVTWGKQFFLVISGLNEKREWMHTVYLTDVMDEFKETITQLEKIKLV